MILAAVAILQSSPLEAATVGTATFALEIVDSDGFGFKGTLTFDSQSFDVFGTQVNLGALQSTLNLSGQLTGFTAATGDGTSSSSATTLPAGCYARAPLDGCEGCACEDCTCSSDASCCTTAWSSTCATSCASCSGCPPEFRRLDLPNASLHCRTSNGAAPSLCTAIGDVVFFEGDVPTVIDLTNFLPPGLIYTLDGIATLVGGTWGATRTFAGQLTLNGFLPPDPITNPPCQGNPPSATT